MAHITGLALIIGLSLAGSDGPYFPYINFAGAALFYFVPALAKGIHHD